MGELNSVPTIIHNHNHEQVNWPPDQKKGRMLVAWDGRGLVKVGVMLNSEEFCVFLVC